MAGEGPERVGVRALGGRPLVACGGGPYQRERGDRLRGQAGLVLRDGAFYVYATLEVAAVPTTDVDDFLGVDLGIVNIATDSDATVYSGEGVERQRPTFAHRPRNLQRRQTPSAKRQPHCPPDTRA